MRDVPLGVTVDDLNLGGWDFDVARRCFAELELKSTWDRVVPLLKDGTLGPPAPGSLASGPPEGESAGAQAIPDVSVAEGAGTDTVGALAGPVDARPAPEPAMPGGAEEVARLLGELITEASGGPIAIAGAFQGLPGRAPLFGLAVVSGGPAARALWIDGDLLPSAGVRRALAKLAKRPVVGHEVKEVLRSLLGQGIGGLEPVFDSAVAAYLLDPSRGDYPLAEVAAPFLHGATLARAETEPQGQLSLDGPVTADVAAGAVEEASIVTQLVAPMRAAVEAAGMLRLLDEVECPLIGVLARMEVTGIRVDTDELRRVCKELAAEVRRAGDRGPRAGRPSLQRQLDTAAAHGALRRDRAQARPADQDRVLDRRGHPRGPA